VSARSTCIRRQVGAIIIDGDNLLLSSGYNGVPQGFDHCLDKPCAGAKDESGDSRRCLAVHAEANAIIHCHRIDLARTIYTTCAPCFECAKLICNTPIRRVVSLQPYHGQSEELFKNARIKLEIFEPKVSSNP
jgi:dCMP deaminase